MINFYDFEVFKYDWLVVIINPFTKEVKEIANDKSELEKYYREHSGEIYCGYNNRHYDQYIMKAILAGFDPWEVNEWIIIKEEPGYAFSTVLNNFQMINFDTALLGSSLKQLEGFQGHNIHETGVDFNIDRKLTQAEIDETFEYCRNDVKETINVFMQCKSDFDAQLGLVKMFNLPLSAMSMTKAQISAEILGCERKDFNDEWDWVFLPCIKLNKYSKVYGWFNNMENRKKDMLLIEDVCGVPHQFGLGGLHGALLQYHYKCGPDDLILHVDVASYYPSLMIFWNLLTRASNNPDRYKLIYEWRLGLKRQGKKKEQAPLKIVLNGTFGISKDIKSKAYDPRNASSICVNGQLLLLDLLEKLETVKSFQLIQSNTDGLIIKIKRKDFDLVDDICHEWETRTKMNLEFDYIKEIWQKDVNNYLFVQFDGKIERKGGYVKELSRIDNDLPIINKALVEYMLHGTSPVKTITDCDDLMMFQKICKLTSKFQCVTDGKSTYKNKCYRIFASKRNTDGVISKVKSKNGKSSYFKFANTSDHSFIENGDITDKPVPSYLDKQWYIDLALERLKQFGIEV